MKFRVDSPSSEKITMEQTAAFNVQIHVLNTPLIRNLREHEFFLFLYASFLRSEFTKQRRRLVGDKKSSL
jgi:hypothetical protein